MVSPMQNQFTAVFEKDGEWWLAYAEELPGANTQGATIEEARENLREAIAMVLEANRELAEQQIAGRQVIKEQIAVTSR
jgi:predicted RNase H-like HicB family nuclease